MVTKSYTVIEPFEKKVKELETKATRGMVKQSSDMKSIEKHCERIVASWKTDSTPKELEELESAQIDVVFDAETFSQRVADTDRAVQ